jgi:Tfp pilus assembly protein PilW
MIELLVSISATLIVMMGVVTLTTTVLHSQDRINRRVDANSRGRPAMTRIVQGLHSACVTSHIVPIRTGSTGTSISFLSKSGSAVGPTPDLHTVSLSGSTLREAVFPMTGTAPNWTPLGTPLSNAALLTNVGAPGGAIFRYYDFINGGISTTPLPTPLSDTNAARVSYVTIAFTVSPSSGVSSQDLGSPMLLNSGADLRLENAGQFPNQDNLPCI